MKAILLAAGRGERMGTLTDALPKPLIRVDGKTLIEYNLERLMKAGIRDVMINVHYLAEQIIDHVGDGKRFGLNITYSHEAEKCLGTGGGIFRVLKFLGDKPFLVLSSDIWTDYPFHNLCTLGDKFECDGHLILVQNPYFHTHGDFCLLETGYLDKNKLPKLTYASFAVMHPRLFKNSKPGCFSLAPIIESAMAKSAITGELYQGRWFNVGTNEELKRVEQMLLLDKEI